MSHEKWFIGCTHFFHAKVLKFLKDDNTRLRPFNSLDEMHELLVNNWNSVVGTNDYIYHLGDVTFQYHKPFQELMYSLNGMKRLIIGNHDKVKQEGLTKHFEKVELWKGFKDLNFTCSHMPLKKGHFRDGVYNVHAHVHSRTLPDPDYINTCVEVIGFKPIHIDEISEIIKLREHAIRNKA